ncbi:MAG: hypothetical protein WBO10_06260 [Pyrinomonadaceae bacterium]
MEISFATGFLGILFLSYLVAILVVRRKKKNDAKATDATVALWNIHAISLACGVVLAISFIFIPIDEPYSPKIDPTATIETKVEILAENNQHLSTMVDALNERVEMLYFFLWLYLLITGSFVAKLYRKTPRVQKDEGKYPLGL